MLDIMLLISIAKQLMSTEVAMLELPSATLSRYDPC